MDIVPAECSPISLEAAAAWNYPGFIFEEKHDGIRAIAHCGEGRVTGRRFGDDGRPAELTQKHAAYLRAVEWPDHLRGTVLDGELMPDGRYIVFDILRRNGIDLRRYSLRRRKEWLQLASEFFPEFVEECRYTYAFTSLGHFSEGFVIKDEQAIYGRGWIKAKRVETSDVRVLSVDSEKQSAAVDGGGRVTGVPACVRAGDLIEVEFFKRFASGRLRNGRFLRVRDDKDVCNDDSRYTGVSASR